MFGRKKMYKKGMADALQANEAFAKKQEEAIKHLREEVSQGRQSLENALNETISKLGGEVTGLWNYLNSREKETLYNLYTPIDIKDIDEEEKHLLVAILYQLAAEENPTEAQSKFISSIQKYLQITNPQMGATLNVVENIDSLAVQKVFLQVILEFFYLKDGDELSDSQEDFLSYFSISKSQAELIEQRVSFQFSIVGADGVAEKYGFKATPSNDGSSIYTDKTLFVETREEIEQLLKKWSSTKKHVFLPYRSISLPDIDTVCYNDYPSKSSCKDAAESELRKLYNAINDSISSDSANSIAVRARKNLIYRDDFEKIHHYTRMLKKYSGISSELDRIDQLANYKDFESAMSEKFSEILDDSFYTLEPFSYYSEDIEYENDDCEIEEGFLRILEKLAARWSWDMTTPWDSLCRAHDSFSDSFCSDASYAVSDYLDNMRNRIMESLDEIASKLQIKKSL